MKKTYLVLVLFVAAVCCLSATPVETKVTYHSYPLYKIMRHSEGYVILYARDGIKIGTAYVPYAWFKGNSKAIMIPTLKGNDPVMSVFYNDGQFDYVKVVVPTNKLDPVWGVIPRNSNIQVKFDPETLVLE